ncbi:MarR family winged helix-turn-helix transcriptional regulator [Chroogloeocystis siderophila]|uniref:MarR family transcriptional regulator n=1 Tax=Chroogloeocystis siderophila 5.2 s.c.1 TaxID=247279 RepID=A0A1U7HXN9_9CHRO|nr:MarR family transcriptional regulator [Chroogloeocystis siderophila]OKH28378.1 MarR family transcriptional regulator [Chroogloeocystis siderophila 5.2 s.c.1]
MGTRHHGTEEEVRALDTYIKLVRAADSISSRIHRHLDETNLTITQFGVLEALYHLGSMYQRDLAAKLLKSGGNITLVIDNLEKRELVKREREPDDRRCIRVNLTEAGKQLISRIFPTHVAAVVTEMATLSLPEQEELGRLCRQLGKKE